MVPNGGEERWLIIVAHTDTAGARVRIRIAHIGKARSANWMWRQEKMAELKPCPFCGGEAAFLGTTCTIKCKQCGGAFIVTSPVMTRMETVAAWNRRVNDD